MSAGEFSLVCSIWLSGRTVHGGFSVFGLSTKLSQSGYFSSGRNPSFSVSSTILSLPSSSVVALTRWCPLIPAFLSVGTWTSVPGLGMSIGCIFYATNVGVDTGLSSLSPGIPVSSPTEGTRFLLLMVGFRRWVDPFAISGGGGGMEVIYVLDWKPQLGDGTGSLTHAQNNQKR